MKVFGHLSVISLYMDQPAELSHVEVDYTAGSDETPAAYPTLETKLEQGISICLTALEQYESPAVLWTGGKDSTLVLYLLQEVAEQYGHTVPPAIFIDHFQHFPETLTFVREWADTWNVDLQIARNAVFTGYNPGDTVAVADLPSKMQKEIRHKLEYEDDTFPFLLDTFVGNHVLKTVPLNNMIETHGIDGIISGVRWDEQAARSDETFFSPRHDVERYPPHDRIHPILQFDERSVWEVTWQYIVPDNVPEFPEDGFIPSAEDDLPGGLHASDIPVSPKYWEGFRSLGSEVSTQKSQDIPAWLQDLDNTVEREGRAQDKEALMERLRDLGYM